MNMVNNAKNQQKVVRCLLTKLLAECLRFPTLKLDFFCTCYKYLLRNLCFVKLLFFHSLTMNLDLNRKLELFMNTRVI